MQVNRQIYNDVASSNLSSGFILDHEKIEVPNFINLCVYACQYDVNFYNEDLFNHFNIVYPKHISQAVNKRKAEYLTGRYSASLALKHLGITGFADIPTGRHRCPIWPHNVLGSITHNHCKAYAAVAYCTDYHYIGIDYEKIITMETAENIRSMIVNEDEAELLMCSSFNFALALTILFSAKESLFKALYPFVGQYFDFSAASIISVFDKDKSFELQLNQSLNNRLIKGSRFKGWFSVESNHVLTIIA